MDKIDFVILWVDGNDPEWQAEKSKYEAGSGADGRAQRYRDWDTLRYWFRGVEKFAPWVNRIHFVTWGHVPKWLNGEHPKINIVKHTDFIPLKYLPTFSCNTIELNLHRIPGIEEQFVYFNDDMYLINHTKESDFFWNGLPCDTAVLNIHCFNNAWTYAQLQAVCMVNKYFDMHTVIRKNFSKWINPIYREKLLRTLYLLPTPRFPGIWQPHLPASYLALTFEELWEKEEKVMDETCKNKFRQSLDYTQATFRSYQLAKGNFVPRSPKIGKAFYLGNITEISKHDDEENVQKYIRNQKGKMICVNDGEMDEEEFKNKKTRLISAFESILPSISSFERV